MKFYKGRNFDKKFFILLFYLILIIKSIVLHLSFVYLAF